MFSVSSHAKHSDSVLNWHPAFAALVSWRTHSHHSVCTIKARRMSTRNHDSIPGIDQANWTGIAVDIWAILSILIVSHWHFTIGISIDVVVVFDIVVAVIGVVVVVIGVVVVVNVDGVHVSVKMGAGISQETSIIAKLL